MEGKRTLPCVIQSTVRLLSVSPRATRLLIVILHRFSHGPMNDKANVALIDAHAKTDRGDNNGHATGEPLGLDVGTISRPKS